MADVRYAPKEDLAGFGVHEAGEQVAFGNWPVAGFVWARMRHITDRRLLEAYFASTVILRVGPRAAENLREDPLFPLFEAFREACERLSTDTAWLDTAAYYGDPDWLDRLGSSSRNRELAELALIADVDALAEQYLTLLWLDSHLANMLTVSLADRDVVTGEGGLLLFGHKGAERWL